MNKLHLQLKFNLFSYLRIMAKTYGKFFNLPKCFRISEITSCKKLKFTAPTSGFPKARLSKFSNVMSTSSVNAVIFN